MTEQTSDSVTLPDIDPSARITRVPTPIASPGCCVLCGKNEHPLGFAATDNLDFEFYGTVYFCADCVGDYARAFGYLSPSDFADLRTHIELQDEELRTLRQAVLGLESTVDNLAGELARRSAEPIPVNDTGWSIPAASSSVSSTVDQPNAELTNVDDPGPVVLDGQVTEYGLQQAAEQGPDDVYDTSGADELLGL